MHLVNLHGNVIDTRIIRTEQTARVVGSGGQVLQARRVNAVAVSSCARDAPGTPRYRIKGH